MGLSIEDALVAEKIRKAFLNLALQHHPDKARQEERKEKTQFFQQIRAAHDRLIGRCALPRGRKASAAAGQKDEPEDDDEVEEQQHIEPEASPDAPSGGFFHEPTDSHEIKDAKNKLKRKGCDQLLGAALTSVKAKRSKLVRGMSFQVARELERELRAREVWRSFFRISGPFPLNLARCSTNGYLIDRCYRPLVLEFAARRPMWKPRQAGVDVHVKAPHGLLCLATGEKMGWDVRIRNRHGILQTSRFLLKTWKSWQLCYRLAELQLAVWRRRDAEESLELRVKKRPSGRVTFETAALRRGHQAWRTRPSGAARIVASAFGIKWLHDVIAGDSNPAELAVAEVLAVELKHRLRCDDPKHIREQVLRLEAELFGGWPLPFNWLVVKKAGSRKVNSAYFPSKETALEALGELNRSVRQGWTESAARRFHSEWGAKKIAKEPTLADEKALAKLLRQHAGEPPRRWRMSEKCPAMHLFKRMALSHRALGAASLRAGAASLRAGTAILQAGPARLQAGAAQPVVSIPRPPPMPRPPINRSSDRSSANHSSSNAEPKELKQPTAPIIADKNLPLCEQLRQLEEMRKKGTLQPEQHAVAVQRILVESSPGAARTQVPEQAQRILKDQRVPKSKWPDVWTAVVHHKNMKHGCAEPIADVCTRLKFKLPLLSASMVDSSSSSRRRRQGLFT